MTTFLPLALVASAALAVWVAGVVRRRPAVPGGGPLLWLLAAIAVWCLTSAGHAVAGTLEAKLAWAKVQYLGVASVPLLWFLFTAEYAEARWSTDTRVRAALGIIPALTLLAAATNEWHLAVWPSVRLQPNGATIYEHGWWFWVATAFHYVVMLAGSWLLVRSLRRSPPPYRGQWLTLIVAALCPWLGNLLYLGQITPPGFDPTPVAFALSALFFAHGLYRDRLFELIPVARDVVIESLNDGVIVLDAAKRVLDMNAAARVLAGQQAGWVGQPVGTLLPLLRDLRLDAVSDSSTTMSLDRPGRGTAFYDVRVIRVRTRDARAAAWVVVLRDISDQLRAEAARAALEARVQEQQKRESLSVLAGGLAHDFNNLLTGIVGNADLLSLQIPPSSELGSNVGAILLGAQRAADLVDKMLAYAGERHGSTERLDLSEVIREMVDLLRASAARHCRLEFQGEAAILEGDPTQIRQVAMNLIINAADAVEEGRGVIVVSVGTETLTGTRLSEIQCADDATPGEYGYLEVLDNGPGMDAATLGRIFEPFFTTKSTGHGLGLAAVQGIVHGHRGALDVESDGHSGARFRVWFPMAAEQRLPRQRGPGYAQATGVTPVTTRRRQR